MRLVLSQYSYRRAEDSPVVCFFILIRVITFFFFFQAEDGIRDADVTGVQTCALPIYTTCVTTAAFCACTFPTRWTMVYPAIYPSTLLTRPSCVMIPARYWPILSSLPQIGRASCRERV